MTAPRSRRATFRNVERRKTSPRDLARLQIIISRDEADIRIALDGLTDGHTPERQMHILRRVVRACADRLGLTIETSSFMAALATDASLVATMPATRAEALFDGGEDV